MKGYLVNSRQLINYTKWYLSNPLVKYHFDEDDKLADPDNPATFNPWHTIKYAEEHPNVKAFRFPLTSSRINEYNNGFISGVNYADPALNYTHVSDYLDHLHGKVVISYEQLISKIRIINDKIRGKNLSVGRLNQRMDHEIVQTAKHSKKNIHYRKFLGNPTRDDDMINNAERLASKGYPDILAPYREYDDNDFDIASKLKLHDDKICYRPTFPGYPQFSSKLSHPYPVNVYGKIAYFLVKKRSVKPMIDTSKIPHRPVFLSDTDENHIETCLNQDNPISDPKEVADYINIFDKDPII